MSPERQGPTRATASRPRRWLAWLAWPLSLLLLIGSALVGLAGSEKGSRWLLDQLPRVLPGELALSVESGTLLDSITLREISYRDAGLQAQIALLRLRWRPTDLFAGIVRIREFHAQGVRLALPAEDTEPGPPPAPPQALPPLPRLPLQLVLDAVSLADAALTLGTQTHVLHRLEAGGRLDREGLTLQRLELALALAAARISGSARVGAASPHPVQAELRWRGHLPDLGPLQGSLQVSGNLRRLELQLEQSSPVSLAAGGSLGWAPPAAPRFDLSGQWRELNWPPLGEPQWRSPAGRFVLQGDSADYRLSAEARLGGPGVPETRVEIEAAGSGEGADITRLSAAAGPSRIEGQGRIRWTGGLGASAELRWRDLGWPLSGEATLRSAEGSVSFEGQPDAYRIRLDGLLAGGPLPVSRLRAQAEGDSEGLDLRRLSLGYDATRLNGSGRLSWAPALRLDLAGDWQQLRWPLQPDGQQPPAVSSDAGRYRIGGWVDDYTARLEASVRGPGLPAVQTAVEVAGNLQGLALRSASIAHDAARLQGQGRVDWEGGLRWQLDGDWQGLRWPLEGAAQIAASGGRYRTDGEAEDYRLELLGEFDLAAMAGSPRLSASLRGEGNAGGLRLSEAVLRHGAAQVAAEANLDWREGLAMTAEGRWRGLSWPLGGGAEAWRSDQGSFTLAGRPEDYALSVDAGIRGGGAPPLQARLSSRGNLQGLEIDPLRVLALGGETEIRGPLRWSPQLDWQLAVRASDLDPAVHWPDWPGRLAVQARVTGQLAAPAPLRVNVDLESLEGQLREQPVAAEARARLLGEALELEAAEVRVGANQASLSGSYREHPVLSARLDAKDLRGLWPGLAGALEGELAWSGPPQAARVEAKLAARDLRLDGRTVQSATLDWRHLPDDPANSALALLATGAQFDGQILDRLQLEVAGNLAGHRLQARANGPLGKLQLGASGGLQGKGWRGELAELTLEPVQGGQWRLQGPARISAGPTLVAVSPTCLSREPARLCVQADWPASGAASAGGSLESLALESLEGLLAGGLQMTGEAAGQFELTRTDGQLQGRLSLRAPAGEAAWLGAGERQRAAYRNASLQGRYQDDRLDLELGMEVADQGRIEGRIAVGPAAGAEPAPRPLSGQIDVDLPDLAFVATLVPDLESVTGKLRLTTRLIGDLEQPRIDLVGHLRDASARLPRLGLELKNLNLEARHQGPDRVVITGSAESGTGSLRLGGEIDLRAGAEWPLQLTLQGEDFEVANTRQAKASVAPDLRIRASQRRVEVTGSLLVPRATVELQRLETRAVTVSTDEVIVGREDPTARQPAAALEVSSRVELRLGNAIRFTGFGLETDLTGTLQLTTAPGRPPSAQGALDLQRGRYQAYGQNLQIERGQLIFVGPLDNPTLDLRAVRKAGEVTAGLAVSGTLRQPYTRLFSEPPMAESEALAYLLTGGPTARASQRDQAVVAQAALNFGLKQALPVTRQLEEAFQLDEITLAGNTDAEESALLIGKYLTPDLYVRYSYGLIDRIGGLLLRYRLSETLALEAKSGAAQALDLIYSIDTD